MYDSPTWQFGPGQIDGVGVCRGGGVGGRGRQGRLGTRPTGENSFLSFVDIAGVEFLSVALQLL